MESGENRFFLEFYLMLNDQSRTERSSRKDGKKIIGEFAKNNLHGVMKVNTMGNDF